MDKKRYAIIEKYSLPFVQLVVEQGQQEEIFKKLDQIKAIYDETDLADFLQQIGLDEVEKEKSLRFFQSSGSQLLDNFIEIVILNHREGLFYEIVVESLRQLEMTTNAFEVTLQSVQPLSESQKARLIPIIEQKMNFSVRSIKEICDVDLIGGFVISANNKTIDASIKGQLQAIKENLK